MSFSQGLSGLNAASKTLEVIGNNVSNANTVGFKASGAQFADVFASAGAGGTSVGIGTKLSGVVWSGPRFWASAGAARKDTRTARKAGRMNNILEKKRAGAILTR